MEEAIRRRKKPRAVVAQSASAPEVADEEEGAEGPAMENQGNGDLIWKSRCNPGAWRPLISYLSETMLHKIRESLYGRNLLKMKLTSLEYRKLCSDLMRRAFYHEAENIIELRLECGSLWINEAVIQHVLDMPGGSEKEPQTSTSDVEEEYKTMWSLLHAVSARYPDDCKGRGKQVEQQPPPPSSRGRTRTAPPAPPSPPQKYGDQRTMFLSARIECLFKHWREPEFSNLATEEMLLRLLYSVKVERLLLPSQSTYVTLDALKYAYDLDNIDKVAWAYLIFESLRKDVKLVRKGKLNYMACCLSVFVVCLADCTVGNTLVDMIPRGRLYLYSNDLIQRILENPCQRRGAGGTGI